MTVTLCFKEGEPVAQVITKVVSVLHDTGEWYILQQVDATRTEHFNFSDSALDTVEID